MGPDFPPSLTCSKTVIDGECAAAKKPNLGEARVFTASVPLLGYRRADLLPVVCASLPPETHRPLASLCLCVCVCVRARVLQGPQMSCLPLFDPFHLFDFFVM